MIDRIIHNCRYCHIAFSGGEEPYLIPVSFGYQNGTVYIHTARKGRKLDLVSRHNRVAIAFEYEVQLVKNSPQPCGWSFSYYSVVGRGHMEEITGQERKRRALGIIVNHYSPFENRGIGTKDLNRTRLWQVVLEEVSGKKSEDKKEL